MKLFKIYKVTNTNNGKVYIGKTCQTVQQRWGRHLLDAKKGMDLRFYRAIRKYGPEAFSVEIICQVQTEELVDEIEKQWIADLRSSEPEFGYNGTLGGEGGIHTEEGRRKISASTKKRWEDPLYKQRLSEAHKGLYDGDKNPMFGKHEDHPCFGTTLSDEHKAKISETRKRRYEDPEFKKRMSEANKGKHHTEEGRKNISKGLIGNTYRRGIPHSDEVKKRISDSMKARHDEKYRSANYVQTA